MVQKLFKFLKLVKIAIVMVVGSVKDNRTFLIINFMKLKLCNHLIVHFNLVVKMYAQQFYNWKLSHSTQQFKSGDKIYCVMETNMWIEIWDNPYYCWFCASILLALRYGFYYHILQYLCLNFKAI
jgi:hypothetical protein